MEHSKFQTFNETTTASGILFFAFHCENGHQKWGGGGEPLENGLLPQEGPQYHWLVVCGHDKPERCIILRIELFAFVARRDIAFDAKTIIVLRVIAR